MHKPYDLGVFVGRFQHIHTGHEFTINTGLQVCDRMLVLVGSSQEKGTVRNPFDITTRARMIESVFGPEVIVRGLPDYSESNDVCPEWGRHVLDNIRQHTRKLPDIFIYGNDERRSAWFAAQLQEVRGITEMIVARERTNISATQMREWLAYDRFERWSQYANPRLHKHYDELRSELLSVKQYREAVRQKPEGWTDKPVFIS